MENTELKEINEILESYKSVHCKISELENEMKILNEKREILISELNDIRSREKYSIDKMVEKYGKEFTNESIRKMLGI